MLSSHLLSVSLLIALCAAPVAAQSSPEKTSSAIQSVRSVQQDPSTNPDILLLFPNPQIEQRLAEPMDGILTENYGARASQSSVQHLLADAERLRKGDRQSSDGDTLCYAMRIYKVVRDNPHSDSTHAAGYSTCQAATRFRTHTIKTGTLPEY